MDYEKRIKDKLKDVKDNIKDIEHKLETENFSIGSLEERLNADLEEFHDIEGILEELLNP